MKTLPIIAATFVILSFTSFVRLHDGAPALSATQDFITDVTPSTCANRAAEVFASNGLNVTNKGSEHCFGGNNEYTVVVFCDQCGSSLNASISVATNGDGGVADALRERILEYIATGQNTNVSGGPARLWLDKSVFTPGESIVVYFTSPVGYPSNAWVGIIPSNIEHGDEAHNDGYDIAYQYLQEKTSGTLTFTAPAAGSWDFRMNDTDGGGKEVTYVSFTVR